MNKKKTSTSVEDVGECVFDRLLLNRNPILMLNVIIK